MSELKVTREHRLAAYQFERDRTEPPPPGCLAESWVNTGKGNYPMWEKLALVMAELEQLRLRVDSLAITASSALGFLPANVPGARMVKEKIERTLAEIGHSQEKDKADG